MSTRVPQKMAQRLPHAHRASRRLSLRSARRKAFQWLDATLPRTRALNALVLRARFARAHARLPVRSSNPAATFNDFLFERMRADDWTLLERFCIDKEYAKLFACADARVNAARTIEVVPFHSRIRFEDVCERVFARAGQAVVAKPTHGSGSVLFLRESPRRDAVADFCLAASRSYYDISRESQYQGLERKIILEEDLSGADGPPTDYKFFCARGVFIFCQVDVGRFSDHRRRLVDEQFTPIDVTYKVPAPEDAVEMPRSFGSMLEIARGLSEPFRFVRVDLYEVNGRPYFGEMTFAPEGAAGALSSEGFGISVMNRIRAANESGRHAR